MVSKWKDDNRDTRTKIEEGDNNNNVRNKDNEELGIELLRQVGFIVRRKSEH